jgi:hypothetical protein
MKLFKAIPVAALVCAISACGDDNHGQVTNTGGPDIEGYYTGTFTPQGGSAISALALIDYDGNGYIVVGDYTSIPPTVSGILPISHITSNSSTSVAIDLDDYTPTGNVEGTSTKGSETLNATYTAASGSTTASLSGSLTVGAAQGTLQLSVPQGAANLYTSGAALATLNGTYALIDPSSGQVYSLLFDGKGNIGGSTLRDQNCITGTYSVANGSGNAYHFDTLKFSCTNTPAVQGTFTGEGFLESTNAGTVLVLELNDGASFAIVTAAAAPPT